MQFRSAFVAIKSNVSRKSCCLVYFSTLKSSQPTLCLIARKFFDTQTRFATFLAQSVTFPKKNFPTLVALTAVSKIQVQLYPAMHEYSVKNFAIFCYNYFEDLFAIMTFAKNFGFLANLVSKIFSIANALQSKNRFLHDPFEKSYLLRHLTITIAHKNSILKKKYTYYANLVEVHFTNFFQR